MVDSDTFVPEASNYWHRCFLVVLGLKRTFLTNALSSVGVNEDFRPDLGRILVVPRSLYFHTIVWIDDHGTSSCLDMAAREVSVLCNWIMLFLRS